MSEPASKLTPEMERELGTHPINSKRPHDELLQKPEIEEGKPSTGTESTAMGPTTTAAEAAEAKATGKLPSGESQLKRSRTSPEETTAAVPQGRLVVGEESAGGRRERVVESEVRPNAELGQQQQVEEEARMKHEEDLARQKQVEDRVRQIKETERLDSNRGDVQLQKEQEAEKLHQPKNRPDEPTGLEAMKGSAPHKPTDVADTPSTLPPH